MDKKSHQTPPETNSSQLLGNNIFLKHIKLLGLNSSPVKLS